MDSQNLSSASNALKALYHKRGTENISMSLKRFAHSLIKEGNSVAKSWRDNKAGFLDKIAKNDRLKTKGAQLAEIRIKVRASRRKNAASSSASTKTYGNKATV